jgi:glycosyltransferase involved in cell wall biosynthesis
LKHSTVVVCAHNEQNYIKGCLRSILSQSSKPDFIIVVADRCTDQTVNVARQVLASTPSLIIEKQTASWKNSISENLQLGLSRAEGEAFVVVDADIILSKEFLETLVPQLEEYAVVSALVRTDPLMGTLNRLVALWELTYTLTPLGDQPRGGARAISIGALKTVGGFRDVYAWESDLDNRLRHAGFRVKLDRRVSVLHRRKMTLNKSISYQMRAGRARRELGVSSLRTLLHSIVRLRPFVMIGYLTS